MLQRSVLSSAARPLLRRPLCGGGFARSLRTCSPALSSQVTPRTGGHDYLASVDTHKYYDGESLVAHQERVRHDDPGNRTFNYAMIGPPPPARPPPRPARRAARGRATDLPPPPPRQAAHASSPRARGDWRWSSSWPR